MSKLIYLFAVIYIIISFAGCDQDIDYPYEGKDRIQFKHFSVVNNKRVYTDSVVFSFGLLSDTIHVDTAKIVMEYLGKGSDQARTYNVKIVADSTTAVEGTHYEAFPDVQTFRPDKLTDTLRIVVYRDHLSKSFANPKNESLYLRLEESEDFDLGLRGGISMKLLLNDYLSQPTWWTGHGGLGYFHPKKWRILISFNADYAKSNCSFNQNNEGRTYAQGLDSYLRNVPTYDDETGMRLYLTYMQEVEK